MNARLELAHHPCFNESSKHRYGRIHLPVAPKCNIKCNYCDRKYDCVNESRPGVTSAMVTPGPGAALCRNESWKRMPTSRWWALPDRATRWPIPPKPWKRCVSYARRFPSMLLCLATNGLALPDYLDDLAEIGVSHVTVTVNAVDPEIGSRIYAWVRDGKVIYRKTQAAELLLERQLESIRGLHARGIIVKVNTIVIPGVNDHHVREVAKKVAELGCGPPQLHAHLPEQGHPLRRRAGTERTAPGRAAPRSREAPSADAPLYPLPGRCRGAPRGADRSEDWRGCLDACSRETSSPLEHPALRGRGHPRRHPGQSAFGRSHALPDLGQW